MKARERGILVSEAIIQVGEEARRLSKSKEEGEAEIRQAFHEMSTNLQIREEVVVDEFRRISEHHEKKLRLEKDELEFVVAGLQGAITFGSLGAERGKRRGDCNGTRASGGEAGEPASAGR